MTLSFEAPKTELAGRAEALARRLLSGAGAASLDAYRLGECLPFVAHGMTADGALIVAAQPGGPLGEAVEGEPIRVRLDVVKQAPDPGVAITSASIHVLGELSWAGADDVEALGGLPSMVDAMAGVTGARVGVLKPERVVLHDLTGATVIEAAELFFEPAGELDEYSAYERVAGLEQQTLKDLCWAVMVDATPGLVFSKPAPPSVCSHTADRVFCSDVDGRGMTLMVVGREETLLAYVAFATPAATLDELDERLDELMGSALLAA